MRNRHSLRTIGLMLALSLILALVIGGASAQEPKVLVTGLNMVGADPDNSLDPSLSSTVQSIQILDELYIGLTHLNEITSAVEPGMATDWTISEDGLVYTFNLLQNVPWVRFNAETGAVEEVTDESGAVRYVTANDFIYGITRTLDPNTGGDYAYVLAPYIVNGAEFNAGEAAAEDLGVKAIDDYTLEITSPEAVGFAINIYGLWMARAQASWMVDEFGDTWVEAENRQSYGPFVMESWNHDQDVTLAKNTFWPGTEAVPSPTLDKVVFRFLDDTAQFAEYQAGTMQAAVPPAAEIDRIKSDAALAEQYYAGFDSCSLYYGFNWEKAPFDNVNIRKAFSLAIDRDSIVNEVTRDGRIASRWYSRPGITGAPTLENNPELGVGFDPEGAQAALEAGLADLGLSSAADLPAITLGFGDTEYNTLVAQAVQQMWLETLGIEVTLSAMETTTYFDVLEVDAPQVFRAAWCMDYPDANNFLYETTRSDSPNNYTNWSNAEFDQIVDEARVSTDQGARAELYARAEEILVAQEYALAPIFWYVTRQVVSPDVARTFSAIGLERYEKWDFAG